MTSNNLLVFDLDGTLLDSLQSLAKSFNWALKEMGHPMHPVRSYKHIIGDGAKEGAKDRVTFLKDYYIHKKYPALKTG